MATQTELWNPTLAVQMYPESDNPEKPSSNLSPIRILLADSDMSKIEQVIAYTEQEFQPVVRICKSYSSLLPMLREELPEVLLLGMFDALNYFAVCQKCHETWEQLPIILLSRQAAVEDHFRSIAIRKGAVDVVPIDLLRLNQLLHELRHPQKLKTTLPEVQPLKVNVQMAPAGSNITAQTMLTAMREITAIGSKFFGPLAQGNYWRKVHASIVNDFPSLQNWSADHFGVISCNESILQSQLTEEDLRGLRRWVALYISEGERIIVDFGGILKNSNLSYSAIQLLSGKASSELK
jgi:CheY-like chemotaxis protein